MQASILIISHHEDLHADLVAEKIQQRGFDVFRLHLDRFPRDYHINLSFKNSHHKGLITHIPTNQTMPLDNIGAVWLRKSAPFEFNSQDLSPQELAFARSETAHILYGILFSLDVFWLSHPLAVRSSQWKGEQLQRAASMGFLIPDTIITNQTSALHHFAQACRSDFVFKAMSSPNLAANEVEVNEREPGNLATTRISFEEYSNGLWNDDFEALNELPGLFQKYIEKAYELRVTVIGKQCYAAQILSQEDPRTATDYRDFSVKIPYKKFELTHDLEQQCVRFVRSYGLEFGAMDLIVTPENKLVFLENNPGGQFYFIEQLVPELRLCDAVADLLCTGAESNSGIGKKAYV